MSENVNSSTTGVTGGRGNANLSGVHMFPRFLIGYGGRRAGFHTGFRTLTLVLYIGSLPNLAT
jgi:hypothetical protein